MRSMRLSLKSIDRGSESHCVSVSAAGTQWANLLFLWGIQGFMSVPGLDMDKERTSSLSSKPQKNDERASKQSQRRESRSAQTKSSKKSILTISQATSPKKKKTGYRASYRGLITGPITRLRWDKQLSVAGRARAAIGKPRSGGALSQLSHRRLDAQQAPGFCRHPEWSSASRMRLPEGTAPATSTHRAQSSLTRGFQTR